MTTISTHPRTVYIRDANGATYDLPIYEGLTQFLSEEGYRLTIGVGDAEIVLRKNIPMDEDIQNLDAHLNQSSVEALVTIKGLP